MNQDLDPAPRLDPKGFKLFGHPAFERLGRAGFFAGVRGPRHAQHSLGFF